MDEKSCYARIVENTKAVLILVHAHLHFYAMPTVHLIFCYIVIDFVKIHFATV